MLRVHTSHRTEVLLDAFARALAAERAGGSPFSPARVVVPNRNVESYLRFGVAERLGIAVNLDITFLRRLFAWAAEQAVPGARVASTPLVEGHLLALLHDARLLERAELAPARAYLLGAGHDADAVDRRRAQLAVHLARLFEEYASTRAELLDAWREAALAAPARPDVGLEAWQRALWLAIFGPGGRLPRQGAREGVRYRGLETLWDEATRASPGPLAGQTVHVFGLSYIASAYHRMLAALARVADVRVYTLNPCSENLSGQAGAEGDGHLAVRLWGRPGRENLRILASVGGAMLEQDFSGASSDTLLGRLQGDIVAGRAPAAPASPDASLRVLPCPSLRRELEVVAAEIWALLRADPTLRACDIAVVVPEKLKDVYLAQLPAVFAESCDLPHNLADLPWLGSHPVTQALAALIELPFGALSRKELLPLLAHPCVRARFPAATAEDWGALAAALGIVRGAERGDFEAAYLERDLYSWEQGLTRLALGAVADADAAETPFALGGDLYLPGPAIETEDEAALGFGLLARSLVADARLARGETGPRERPLAEWVEYLRRLATSYLVLDDEDGEGQAIVGSFLASLAELDDGALADQAVSYRVAAERAKRALGELPYSRGHYLASGVTVASFVPMRAIPFRAIFVLGLGEAAFPRARGRHELDLRAELEPERRPGDVDAREQDLYMFLETLLSAREHLTLSYVSRDELTGDELPASSALGELRAVLAGGYLDAAGLERVFGERPADRPRLRRYDDEERRREVLPAAEAEARARELGKALGGAADAAAVAPRLASLPPRLGRAVARVLGLPGRATGAPPAWPATLRIPLAVLRRFLVDPLRASARFALGMHEIETYDEGAVDEEPFDLEPLEHVSIVRQAIAEALVEAQAAPAWESVAAALARAALAAELAGRVPSGRFREPAAARQEAILRTWQEGLPAILGHGRVACRRFRFVPGLEHEPDDARRPPPPGTDGRVSCKAPTFEVALPAADGKTFSVNVTLVGETGWWARGEGETHLAFTTRKRFDPKGLAREDVAAFLEHVTLVAAATAEASAGFASAICHVAHEQPGLRARHLGGVTAAAARDYLGRLCAALLRGVGDGPAQPVHPYLLPLEAVLVSHAKGKPVDEAIAQLAAEEERRLGRGERAPAPWAAGRFAPPPPAEAAAMIAERFGLFFALAEGGKA